MSLGGDKKKKEFTFHPYIDNITKRVITYNIDCLS